MQDLIYSGPLELLSSKAGIHKITNVLRPEVKNRILTDKVYWLVAGSVWDTLSGDPKTGLPQSLQLTQTQFL